MKLQLKVNEEFALHHSGDYEFNKTFLGYGCISLLFDFSDLFWPPGRILVTSVSDQKKGNRVSSIVFPYVSAVMSTFEVAVRSFVCEVFVTDAHFINRINS